MWIATTTRRRGEIYKTAVPRLKYVCVLPLFTFFESFAKQMAMIQSEEMSCPYIFSALSQRAVNDDPVSRPRDPPPASEKRRFSRPQRRRLFIQINQHGDNLINYPLRRDMPWIL